MIFGDRNNNPEPEDIPGDHSYDSVADSDYEPEDPDGDSVDDEPHDNDESHGQTPNTRYTVVTVATNEQPPEEALHTFRSVHRGKIQKLRSAHGQSRHPGRTETPIEKYTRTTRPPGTKANGLQFPL